MEGKLTYSVLFVIIILIASFMNVSTAAGGSIGSSVTVRGVDVEEAPTSPATGKGLGRLGDFLGEELPQLPPKFFESIEGMFLLFLGLGGKIWPGFPRAGLLIFTIFLGAAIFIPSYNMKNHKAYKNTSIYARLLLGSVVSVILISIFVVISQSCKIDRLGNIGGCYVSFGQKIWPGSPLTGLLIFLTLLVVVIILSLLIRRRLRTERFK